ncbi:hypothetical protein ACOSOMT5_P1644 [Acidiphilium sp. MT5]
MSFAPPPLRRRQFLTSTATATIAAAAALPTARAATPTQLNTMVPTLSKASVGYIDIPHDGEVCGACIWFKPPNPGTTTSHCHLVAGPISAAGWCQAWMRRS